MAVTFKELCENLKEIDEVTLLELLDISSEDIVYHFQDKIEDKIDELEELVNDNKKEFDIYDDNIT
jgi:tetrahydromethanopterin S-methyltransferase subunit B